MPSTLNYFQSSRRDQSPEPRFSIDFGPPADLHAPHCIQKIGKMLLVIVCAAAHPIWGESVLDTSMDPVHPKVRKWATDPSASTGKCTPTHELTDYLRRILFHYSIPPEDRFSMTTAQARWIWKPFIQK